MTAVDEPLRAAVAELEAYLDGVDPARRDGLVLPFATRWVLPELGLDLARLRAEARTLVEATPLSDRIVAGHADHMAYWVSQRMRLDGGAATLLARARERLGARADELEGFPRVADGLRGAAALDDEALELGLAARIAETVLP